MHFSYPLTVDVVHPAVSRFALTSSQWCANTWNCKIKNKTSKIRNWSKNLAPQVAISIFYHSNRNETRILGFFAWVQGRKGLNLQTEKKHSSAIPHTLRTVRLSSYCWLHFILLLGVFPGLGISRFLVSYLNNNNNKAHTSCKVARNFIKRLQGILQRSKGLLKLVCSRASVTVVNFLLWDPSGGVGC